MKKILLVLAALLLLAPASSLARPLDTGVILELLDAGVSDLSIQRYVQRNHFTFDLSAQDLKTLKRAGASDALIGFLQDREEGPPSLAQEEQTRPSDLSRDDEEYGEGYDSGDYGVSSYAPYYSGYAYGYPYYSGFYYPYYYPYYGYPNYSYGYPYPHYGGGHGGHGTGVVSYWNHNQSSRGSSRPSASGSPPPSSRGSSHHGGGRGRH
jgi:hypothetical protein